MGVLNVEKDVGKKVRFKMGGHFKEIGLFGESKDLVIFLRKSISAWPRKTPKNMGLDREGDVRWAVMTLARALGAGSRRPHWSGSSWQYTRDGDRIGGENQDGSPVLRQGEHSPERASPAIDSQVSSGKNGDATGCIPNEQRPHDWRSSPMPRRGPPVTAIKVPRWYRPVVRNERRSHENVHRSPLRGGPLWSSDDPRLSKSTLRKSEQEAKGKKEK